MRSTILTATLLALAVLPCAAKPDQEYRSEIRSELHAKLSPVMWAEVKDMLVDSPGQGLSEGMPSHGPAGSVSDRIKLTGREEKDLRALLQLDGKGEPPWLKRLRAAQPTTFQTEGTP
jgi:hypothetical protein